jgi:hypothetical protein
MKRKAALTRDQVEAFEQVTTHLSALALELGGLAKKSPDAVLNKFKIRIVNERLQAANELLTGIHKPFRDFAQFDDADLPSASDVVIVLSQYMNSLEGWRSAHILKVGYNWFWDTPEQDYSASSPSRFKHEAEE